MCLEEQTEDKGSTGGLVGWLQTLVVAVAELEDAVDGHLHQTLSGGSVIALRFRKRRKFLSI